MPIDSISYYRFQCYRPLVFGFWVVAQQDTAIRVDMPLYPRDPRCGPGYVDPVYHRVLAEDENLGFKPIAS
jgi:hypothetical protein